MAEAPPVIHRGGLGHEFENPEIPSTLSWNMKCRNFEEYRTFISTVYATLRVTQRGGRNDFIATRFISLTPVQVREQIRVLQGFADARATPVWLFRLLATVRDPPAGLTRANLQAILQSLNNEAVNNLLKTIFGVPADRPDNEILPLEYVQRWIIAAHEGIVYAFKKSRLGYEFNQLFDKYQRLIDNLTTKVDEMLLNLEERNSVNRLAIEAGRVKQQMFEACEVYVKYNNEELKANIYPVFQEFRDIENFNFNNFRTINQNGTLWLNHFSQPDAANFEANSVREIKDAATRLTPLVKEIRGFSPSSLDLAKDKAVRVKAAIGQLTGELDSFLDQQENRTLAKAKTLMTSVKFYKEKCESLNVDGVSYDEINLGVTPQKFAAYYESLFNFITDAEQEIKKKENRDRVEANEILKTAPSITLPPLRGISDWLDFKAALDKIMPFHSSDIIKCTLIKNALRDRADVSRCKNLNYEGIYNYLCTRYQDSSLIPRLIDRLLSLKTARDNKISYENLTEFLSVYSQLELHNGTDRLDSFVREKLVSLLLPNHLECDFLASQIKQEKEWKKELIADDDDGASTSFSVAKGDEYEERRRDNYVSSMKVYLEIMRKVVATNGGETTTSPSKKNFRKNRVGVNAMPQRSRPCPACGSSHHVLNGNQVQSLSACNKFKSMPVEERFKLCGDNHICKRCLCSTKDGNHANGCKKSKEENQRCKKCHVSTHHELLCLPEKKKKEKSRNRNPKKKGKPAPQANKTSGKNNTTQSHCVQESPEGSRTNIMTSRTRNAVRMFLSACSNVTVALKGNQISILLSLLDCGSGLNLVLLSTANKLGLRQIKTWCGTISTINGDSKGEYPVFLVPVKDITGKTHNIAAIGIDHIGYKTPVPSDLFNQICDDLHISPNIVQNCSGQIQMLVGLESRILLARQSTIYNSIPKTDDFPGVAVYESIVSPMYMLIGAVGPTLADDLDVSTKMYNVSIRDCYYADAIEDNEHNHALNISSSFFQQSNEVEDRVNMPNLITSQNMDEDNTDTPIQTMALLDIKKTAANLSHLDAAPLPDLVCPACKLVLSKCNSCKYLNSEASIRDLEELAIIKANMRKIIDPENPEKFYIFFDYVFKNNPKDLYAPQHTNKYLGKKSALRLRQRLLKEGMMDIFHAEMLKSINREHFAEVTGDLKKTFDKLQIECYINFNYVVKTSSLSQACRPVSDSTAYHKNGDLNSQLLAGIQSINNPLHIIWKFLYNSIGWSCDYSRAYRSVLTGDIANAVRRFYWFKDPYNEDSLTEYCLIRLNYGDSCSSAVLEEAIRNFIAPECKTELANNILSFNRYIDDTLASFSNKEEMVTVQEDIIQASDKANFLVKHTIFSGSDPVDEEGNLFTNVLAMKWYFKDDLLFSNVHFNTYPKKRGAPTGPDLSEDIARTTSITKTIMCRLAGQSFSFTQAHLLPVTMALRIIFSKVSTLSKEWNEDIAHIDEEFTEATRKTLAAISNVHEKIFPVERAICPHNYKPWRICISSDGSSEASAACIHVVVKDGKNTSRVTNVAARGKVVKVTVPDAELIGAYIAVNMMQDYIGAMDGFGGTPLEILLATDSLCLAASLNPQKLYKSVKVRNTCFAIHKTISDLVNRFPNLVIKYVHIKGSDNPSDAATKHVHDPVALINSNAWRHGPEFFKDPMWPSEEIVFLKGDATQQLHFKPPIAQQHVDPSDNNCITCHNAVDFCGSTMNYCQECQGSDNSCMNAQNHVTDTEEIPPNNKEEFHIPDEERDDFPAFLDYDSYIQVIINSRSLIKAVHIVCILLQLTTIMKKRGHLVGKLTHQAYNTTNTMVKRAWRVLIRSSQKYFPPENISMWFPFSDSNNIVRARTRFMHADQPGDIICMSSPPIISFKDHRLITLIIRHAHVRFISPQLYDLHLQKNITIANVRNSIFSAEITRMDSCVKRYIKNCVQCMKMKSMPLAAALGTPRWFKCLQNEAIPFSVISIDPIGEFLYTIPNMRGPPRKCYILVVSCILTTAVSCYVMTGLSKTDIYQALYNHFQRYVEAKLIYADAGSSVKITDSDPQWNQYFGSSKVEIINVGTEEHFANFVESKIRVLKQMLKSTRLSRTANKLPLMTMPQVISVFDTFSNLLNTRPLFASSDGSFILSPNHLLKNWVSLENIADNTLEGQLDGQIDLLENQLKRLCQAMNIGAKLFMENLKYTYLSDTKNLYTLQQQTTKPRKGDIVMVSRRDSLPLGVVENSVSQFCWVRRRKNNIMVTERVNFRKIYILHRPYQSHQPPASKSQVYQLRRSRGVVQTWIEERRNKISLNVLMPHPFSDVIFDNSYLYYFIDDTGVTHIIPRQEEE